MSYTTQTVSLLAYVIAYLQEEQKRRCSVWSVEELRSMIDGVIDAYAGGAR